MFFEFVKDGILPLLPIVWAVAWAVDLFNRSVMLPKIDCNILSKKVLLPVPLRPCQIYPRTPTHSLLKC